MSDRIELSTSDGLTLEARWDSAGSPAATVVFCHAHPLQGGTMNNPLMIAVTLQLVEHGFSVLRFNFRGTGSSDGQHGNGVAELLDIDAAFDEAGTAGLPIGIAGWSFGAGTSLRWLSDRGKALTYVGIAPAADYLPPTTPAGPKRIILGTRDQVIDGQALMTYSADNGIDLVLTPGDHFFHGKGKRIGDLVAEGFRQTA